jgi:hypothetical protein
MHFLSQFSQNLCIRVSPNTGSSWTWRGQRFVFFCAGLCINLQTAQLRHFEALDEHTLVLQGSGQRNLVVFALWVILGARQPRRSIKVRLGRDFPAQEQKFVFNVQ